MKIGTYNPNLSFKHKFFLNNLNKMRTIKTKDVPSFSTSTKRKRTKKNGPIKTIKNIKRFVRLPGY